MLCDETFKSETAFFDSEASLDWQVVGISWRCCRMKLDPSPNDDRCLMGLEDFYYKGDSNLSVIGFVGSAI